MYRYATKEFGENMARAAGVDLPLSSKQSVEICSWLRGKNLILAKEMLNGVIAMKVAVPYKRFNKNVGHKTGMAAGRYPIKAASHVLKLVESVEANAQFKGLNTANLVITHICAHKGARSWHYGRHRGRKVKRTSIEVVVQEKAPKEKKEKKAEQKKETTQPAKKEKKQNNTKVNEESKGGN